MSYAAKKHVLKTIRFGAQAQDIQEQETGWVVHWVQNKKSYKNFYNYLVVAVEIFAEPHIPNIEILTKFRGHILHSSNYVVGNSKIASDLAF